MSMDKNGKLFGKISLVDILVVILIIGVIAGTVYKFTSPNTSVGSGEVLLTYTLKINGVRDFTYEYYKEGFECYDSKTGEYIGKIAGVRQEPYRERVVLLDGTVDYFEKPNVIVIYVDIETKGTENAVAFFAQGTYELKAGSEIQLQTKYVEVIGVVDNVYAR